MKSPKRFFARSSQTPKSSHRAKRAWVTPFETLEGRQLMSATTIAEVNWMSPSGPQTVTYEIGSNHQVYESTGDGKLINLGGQVSQIAQGWTSQASPRCMPSALPASTLSSTPGRAGLIWGAR